MHAGGDPNTQLANLLVGRDTRWWRGHLGKLNLVIVSTPLEISGLSYLCSCWTEERILELELSYSPPLTSSLADASRSSSSSPP